MYPPPDMGLVGWRDPFIFEFKGQEGKQEWGMLLGSGIKGKGGAVMIYRSPSLHDGARWMPISTSRRINAARNRAAPEVQGTCPSPL